MTRFPIATFVLALMLGLAAPAGAANLPMASNDQPIHVVADSLEVNNKAQVADFIGQVKAVQGDVKITCDKLSVFYDQEGKQSKDQKDSAGMMDGGGKVRKVVAQGHVKVVQKDRIAVGRKATYWAGGRKMLLEGKATVWRGKNQISGDKITVFLDQDRAVVHGKPGKRVSVTITPNSLQDDKDKKKPKKQSAEPSITKDKK
ncbi:MAG: lipopolysaccharide transport periplasmic protein LptA [Desulfarculaceae bacterium]|nr:lipopolysaccharide transport periplasmic protein LptA [Desulfarculaceae bacterium]MCF8072323.1 lipopolysaccharide transport periplasmic protein LptA [Desulfarculaceae bacterium]MCF8100244.1 lipopolysaccharide transport periplasmic protein LptA [Desulfarculaceae bacterium]MCF8116183.1 lipopolysaccharide transport periplasmic protein LptA [Desulfarculaceae bacterium]